MKTVKLEGDKVPGKRIKSTDPRKPGIVALFKQEVACCSKVTELSEIFFSTPLPGDARGDQLSRNGCFFARCLSYRPVNGRQTFMTLGVFSLWGDRGATIVPEEQLKPAPVAWVLADPMTLAEMQLTQFLAATKRNVLEALVYHLAATSAECESCDDPNEVLRVIKLALEHPQVTGR